MARTIRRKNGDQPFWLKRQYSEKDGIWAFWLYEPEEVKRKQVEWHADFGYRNSGPSKWFRNNQERGFRSYTKQEFARFWKDTEYEIQIVNKQRIDYWD